MVPLLKRLVASLPVLLQDDLKRMYFRRQIRRNRFVTNEPEFLILDELLSSGDSAVDVGANVGHYAIRMAALVGPYGRIVALEPVPSTFALLASNVQLLESQNVTLVNAAASSEPTSLQMVIPRFDTGLRNYYQAEIVANPDSEAEVVRVLALTLDSLLSGQNIRLVKIDAEGHERQVINGMGWILRESRPHLIVEGQSKVLDADLAAYGYTPEVLSGSPNTLYRSPVG